MNESPSAPSQGHHLPGADLRTVMSRFVTGVTVVTFIAGGEYRGITVNSFCSLSLEPPLVMVALAVSSRRHDLLIDRPFTVNILDAASEPVARHFAAGPPAPHLVRWHEGELAPHLADCLAYLECSPHALHPAGDHTMFIGRVESFGQRAGSALAYYCGRYVQVADPVQGVEHML